MYNEARYRELGRAKAQLFLPDHDLFLFNYYPGMDLLYFDKQKIIDSGRVDIINKVRDFYSIFDNSLDPGIARIIPYLVPDGEAPFPPAQGVPIFQRAPFTRLITDKILTPNSDEQKRIYNHTPVTFLMLDIKRLRNADYAVDQPGEHKAADWILNKVAEIIKQVMDEVDTYKSVDLDSYYCRYGGDEFSIAFVGEYPEEVVNMVRRRLLSEIPTIPGYYADVPGGERKFGITQLKNNEIKMIKVPEDEIDQYIFVSFLKRDILFEQEQIDSIKRKFTKNGQLNRTALDRYIQEKLRPIEIYPKEVESLEQKLEFHKLVHPELLYYIEIAKELDVFDTKHFHRDEPTYVRQEVVLDYIENVLYDRLLRENVHTRVDFQEHLQQGMFNRLIVFDIKFIKEINEDLSYADGDEAIIQLWTHIKAVLTPQERESIMVARYGGTTILGVREGKTISPNTLDKLRSIQSLRLFKGTQNAVTIQVGFSDTHLPDSGEPLTVKQSRELLNGALQKAEDQWYEQIAHIIDENPKVYESLVVAFSGAIPRKVNPGSFISLLINFFTKKRRKERCEKMLKVLEPMRERLNHDLSDELFHPLFDKPEIEE